MKILDELLMKKSGEEDRKITLTEAAATLGLRPSCLFSILSTPTRGKKYSERLTDIAAYFKVDRVHIEKRIAEDAVAKEER